MARASEVVSATCSTHVLGAVRSLNRLDCAVESLRAAVAALAVAAPEWLRARGLSGLDRPLRPGRADDIHAARGARLRGPGLRPERADCCGHALLAAVTAPDAPSWLRAVPAALVLRRVWVQAFTLDDGDEGEPNAERSVVRWRTQVEGFPPSPLMVASPYDPDVHRGPRSGPRPRGSAARLI